MEEEALRHDPSNSDKQPSPTVEISIQTSSPHYPVTRVISFKKEASSTHVPNPEQSSPNDPKFQKGL